MPGSSTSTPQGPTLRSKEPWLVGSRLIRLISRELACLNDEIGGLQEERDGLSNKMGMRSKQFYLLLHTVQVAQPTDDHAGQLLCWQDLQNSLEAEEEQEKAAMEEDGETEEGVSTAQEDVEMADPDPE